MSELLDALIKERREQAFDYREYLKKIIRLAKETEIPKEAGYPKSLNTPAKKALYDNLFEDERLVMGVHEAVSTYGQDDWQNNHFKTRMMRIELKKVLGDDELTDKTIELLKNQEEYI